MRGIEFVNDLRCNYLTIPYDGEENDFALRMLTENMTEGFLKIELRRMDGQTYLYYNISGMQSMEIIYMEKVIDKKAFQTFMWQLHGAIEQSRELFLPGDGICLEPAALFWNLGEQKWEFIYIPGREREEIEKEREHLAEFLVEKIDYADRKLTDTVYRFYEEICAGRMYPDSFLEDGKEEITEDEIRWEVNRDSAIEDKEAEGETEGEITEEPDAEDEWEAESKPGGRGLAVILFLLWCASAAATFFAGRIMQEFILPGSAVTVLMTVLLLYTQIKKKREGSKKVLENKDEAYEEMNIPYEIENEDIENAPEEKTVYMDIKEEQERKLYGIGKFRQQKVCLEGLPCVVGKDKALANHVISDSSVSRMHARFFSEKEQLWMQDLNSTNGTYHNGLRLRPNEKVILEAEDEVGFGRVQFIYR